MLMMKLEKDYEKIINFQVPVLKDFDSLLRCHICKDILNIPVITPCSHTFCSVCIRDYLRNGNDENCPLCLNDLNESLLRPELLLNEICKCYKTEIKSVIVNKLNFSNNTIAVTEDIKVNKSSTKRKLGNTLNESFSLLKQQQTSKKPKTGPNNNTIIDMLSRKKQKSSNIFHNLSDNNTKEKSYCPICNNQFSLKYLQEHHIDNCLTTSSSDKNEIVNLSEDNLQQNDVTESDEEPEPEPKYLKNYLQSALQSNLHDQMPKLPNLQLNDITSSSLKQHLLKYNLPITGSKYNLIQRWKQWDVLYTSNYIDNPTPVPLSSIKNALIKWDTLNNKPITSNVNSANGLASMLDNKKLDIKSEKFSRKNWESKNKRHYKRLIKIAKKQKTNLK